MNSIERVFIFEKDWARLGQRWQKSLSGTFQTFIWRARYTVAGLSIITLVKCSTLLIVFWGKITWVFHRKSVRSILHDNVRCCWVAGNETKSLHFILKLSRGWNFKQLPRNKFRFPWGWAVNGIGCFSSHPSRHVTNYTSCQLFNVIPILFKYWTGRPDLSSSLCPYYVYAQP
jgi:hypothetical protein